MILESQRSIQDEESQSDGPQNETQDSTSEFENLVKEEKADYDMYWSKLSAYRWKFERKHAKLAQVLQSKLVEEQIPATEARLKGLEDLMSKIRVASDFVNRSQCSNSTVRASERKGRSEMVSKFEDVAEDADLAIRTVKYASGGAIKSWPMESWDPKSKLNSTMLLAAACLLRYDCKDIIQRITKFEGDVTKFQRWKDAFELHVDSKPWDYLEKFEFLLKTVGGSAYQTIATIRVSANNQ